MRKTASGKTLGPIFRYNVPEIEVTVKKVVLILIAAAAMLFASEEKLIRRAAAIHRQVLTLDSHCDTTFALSNVSYNIGKRHEPGKRESGRQDLVRMKEGGLDASVFSVFVSQGERTPAGNARAREEAVRSCDLLDRMFARYPDLVERALKPEDAYRIEKKGKRAVYMGMENGYPLGRDLSSIDYFFGRGIRYITLCHTADNDICDSSTDRLRAQDDGLSVFGRDVVSRMNSLGIIVDVSHLSDRSFAEVLRVTKAPVIASHSSCRALCDNPRNLSDDMLRELKKNGGVIQICIFSDYLRVPDPSPQRDQALGLHFPRRLATIRDAVDHIDHVVRRIGVDSVGIGTDFDGGGGIDGCSDVTQLPGITLELVRRGYSKKEIAKIWGGNFFRVFRQVRDVSRKRTEGK